MNKLGISNEFDIENIERKIVEYISNSYLNVLLELRTHINIFLE